MIVDRYYYAQLNKQEQAVYKAFYNGLMAHEDVIPIPIKGQLTKEVATYRELMSNVSNKTNQSGRALTKEIAQGQIELNKLSIGE